jgi:ABC-2 type transport system permease protein
VLTWARTPALTAAAVVAAVVGVGTCVLLARTAVAALASVLASRRFRDLAFVGLALFGVALGLGVNLLGALGSSDPGALRAALADLAQIAGWTPFGWAWAVPADVARGSWVGAGIHLVLALGLVGVLWRTWEHFLDRRLTSPIEVSGEAARVRGSGWADRFYPPSPAGAVAARTLRYWRRDPRYLAGIAGFLIAPVVIIVSQLVNQDGSTAVAAFAPCILGMVVGLSVAQDLSYDGSALWLHVASGLRGAEDRAGRVWSALTVFGPLSVVLLVVAIGFSGEWTLAVPVVGLTVGLMLISLGVGAFVGTLWQWPAAPPGTNPFQTGNSGGLPALASFTVASFGTLLIAAPVIAAVVGSFFTPWVGWLSLPLGLLIGGVVLRLGIIQGGRLLDRRWPEVLRAVSEKSG